MWQNWKTNSHVWQENWITTYHLNRACCTEFDLSPNKKVEWMLWQVSDRDFVNNWARSSERRRPKQVWSNWYSTKGTQNAWIVIDWRKRKLIPTLYAWPEERLHELSLSFHKGNWEWLKRASAGFRQKLCENSLSVLVGTALAGTSTMLLFDQKNTKWHELYAAYAKVFAQVRGALRQRRAFHE